MANRVIKRYGAHKLILAGLDFVCLNGVCWAALWIRFGTGNGVYLHKFPFLMLVSGLWIVLFQMNGLFKQHIFLSKGAQFGRLMYAISYGIVLLIFLSFLLKSPYIVQSRLAIGLIGVGSLLVCGTVRIAVFRPFLRRFAQATHFVRNVLIVGAGWKGREVAAKIVMNPETGMSLVGFLDDKFAELEGQPVFGDIRILGRIADAPAIVRQRRVDEILIAINAITHERLLEVAEFCQGTEAQVSVVSDAFGVVDEKVDVERRGDIPIVRLRGALHEIPNGALKRMVDVAGAVVALVLFAPVLILIGGLVKLTSKGPVFFRQERLGKEGHPFLFYKFRSMQVDADDSMHRGYLKKLIREGAEAGESGQFKIRNDPRVTLVGKFIRKTSLDELPQLLNVLKGDMSLVGPRPPIAYEVEEYEDWHKKRLSVIPGMTGLWQVSGRSSINFEDMVVLDLYYIENQSFWLDLQILLKTFPKLLLEVNVA